MISYPKYSIKKRHKPIVGIESFLVRFYTIMFGFFMVGIIFIFNGVNPLRAYFEIIRIALFTSFGRSGTMLNFIPLLMIGLGIAIPARAQIDNIGAEGQYIMGMLGGFWIAFTFPDLNSFILIPLMFLGGFLWGAIWALPIAIFRVKGGFKGADVVVSFLLVFPAIELLKYMIANDWKAKEQGYPRSDRISENAEIPRFEDFNIPFLEDIHITIFLGLFLIFLVNYFLFRKIAGIPKTQIGYEIEIIGSNEIAAKVAGISFIKIALVTCFISGGLAGMAGIGHLAGNRNNLILIPSLSAGLGFVGIAVAWLGGLNPKGIILSALLFGALLSGNTAVQGSLGLPGTIVDLLNGTILLFVLISEFLLKFSISRGK